MPVHINGKLNPPIAFYDKLTFRMAERPSTQLVGWLRQHCYRDDKEKKDVTVRTGRPMVGAGAALKYRLEVIAPDAEALAFLAAQRWYMNAVHPALDLTSDDPRVIEQLNALFDRCCVVPYHYGWTIRYHSTTYTRRRSARRNLIWYGDRASKVDGSPNCFHLEYRLQGVDALRRAGLLSPADLLTFSHRGYLQQYLRLFEIDTAHLGRLLWNRQHKLRRQRPLPEDLLRGYQTVHSLLAHAEVQRLADAERKREQLVREGKVAKPPTPDINYEARATVQTVIDALGRGPFLREIDVSLLLPGRRHE